MTRVVTSTTMEIGTPPSTNQYFTMAHGPDCRTVLPRCVRNGAPSQLILVAFGHTSPPTVIPMSKIKLPFGSEVERAITSLARSASAPLQVHLPWRSFGPRDDSIPRATVSRVVEDLIKEVSRSAHRLDRVCLGVVHQFARAMYSIFKSPTPSLTFLVLEEYCNSSRI